MKKSIFHGVTLVPRSFRKKGLGIVMLLIISSLLDIFSLATFIPLIVLISNPEHSSSNIFFSYLYKLTGFTDHTKLSVALTIGVFVFILIKTQITIRITHLKALYSYAVAGNFASRAMAQYFTRSYTQFTSTDFTAEMNRISNLPIIYANNYLIPFGTILSESLLMVMLLAAIMLYNLNVALFIMIIILPVAVLYRWQRTSMKNTGQKIKRTYPLLLKYTLQSVEGLLEIRVFRKENFFKKRFSTTFHELGKDFSKDHTALTSSVRLTEIVATLCITVLIIYALLLKQSRSESILLLSIYAGASFRAIPSINRILSASLQIKTHEYAIQDLQNMMAHSDIDFDHSTSPLLFKEKIEVADISFRHTDQECILKNASLTIHKGEKIALVGKSGSGKTTLFLIMMRFLHEQEGKISLDNVPVNDSNASSWRKLIGYVPQNPFILDDTLLENIAFGIPREKIDPDKVKKLLQSLDLEMWANNLPDRLNTVIGERGAKLSGGQRQRIAIARALYHDAEILLLDEVTNQLDRETENDVIQIIHNLALLNKTIILITHRIELWKSFDSVYELKNKYLKKLTAQELETTREYA